MNDKEKQKGRISFAGICLRLAEKEIRQHGRYFMKPGQDVYDSAVQYGGSIKITKEEVLEAERLRKKRKQKPKDEK